MQLQRLTTRPPTDEMMECAIAAMNAALYGLPAHAPRTPEGWAILHGYAESDPAYQPDANQTAEQPAQAAPSTPTEQPAAAAQPITAIAD